MIINTSYIKNQIRATNRIAKFIGVLNEYDLPIVTKFIGHFGDEAFLFRRSTSAAFCLKSAHILHLIYYRLVMILGIFAFLSNHFSTVHPDQFHAQRQA